MRQKKKKIVGGARHREKKECQNRRTNRPQTIQKSHLSYGEKQQPRMPTQLCSEEYWPDTHPAHLRRGSKSRLAEGNHSPAMEGEQAMAWAGSLTSPVVER